MAKVMSLIEVRRGEMLDWKVDDALCFRLTESEIQRTRTKKSWSQNYRLEAHSTEISIEAIGEERPIMPEEHSTRRLLRTDLGTKRIQQGKHVKSQIREKNKE